MFFSLFQYVLPAKQRSIWVIAYDFGTFVMFSIFESVIRVFPKYNNFRVFLMQFTKKSCKSAMQDIRRFMWSLGRRRFKIQEASENVTEGGILFPSFKTSYMKENTKNGRKWYDACRLSNYHTTSTLSAHHLTYHLYNIN